MFSEFLRQYSDSCEPTSSAIRELRMWLNCSVCLWSITLASASLGGPSALQDASLACIASFALEDEIYVLSDEVLALMSTV